MLGNQPIIIDRNILLSCFVIYSLLEDTNFFNVLLTQLLQRWTLLSQILYNNDDYTLPNNVKDDIFLHVPQMLLPNRYINDKVFMNNWNTKHNEQTITLNYDSERFTTTTQLQIISNNRYDQATDSNQDTTTNMQIVKNLYIEPSLPSVNNNDTSEGNTIEYYTKLSVTNFTDDYNSGEYLQEKKYNGKVEGTRLEIVWDDTIASIQRNISTYLHGKQTGPELHYVNSQIFDDRYYDNGKPVGNSKRYFHNGQLNSNTYYDPDRQNITYNVYYKNGNKRYIRHDKKDATGQWYIDYTIKYLENGGVIETDQQHALFYDATGHLISKITNPYLVLQFDGRYETIYDQNGREVSVTKLSPIAEINL